LLAAILVPLFFNVYSSRVFEPDKLSLLRTIALFMAVAWLTKQIDQYTAGPRDSRATLREWIRRPLVLPIALTVLVYLISSLFSVVPHTSWFGSYQRLQGTLTTYSYIVVGLVLIAELRRREQFERLMTVVILTSLPVSLYGIIQHLNLDSMPWGADVTARVASNMGNAIFVGAYLILVIPLTLARLVNAWRKLAEPLAAHTRWILALVCLLLFAGEVITWTQFGLERGLLFGGLVIVAAALLAAYLRQRSGPFIALASYLFILNTQLMCLIYSGSRGPQLGFIIGMALFSLLTLAVMRWRRVIWLWLAGAMVVVAFLLVFNLPQSPLQSLRTIPYLGRLGNLLETTGGTGKVRLLIWQGTIRLLCSDPVRAIVGYGPETMYVVYNRFYPPELAHYESRTASPDRSHNETLDTLVITGVLGYLAYIFLFASLFYYSFKHIGVNWGRRSLMWFSLLVGGGAIAGLILPFAWDADGTYAGVGSMVGFVIGLFIYAVPGAIRLARQPHGEPSEAWRLVWLAALAGGVLAHLVEINFGIAIAVTRLMFWVSLGLTVALAQRSLEAQPCIAAQPDVVPVLPAGRSSKGKRRSASATRALPAPPVPLSERNRAISHFGSLAILLGVILSVIAWNYITNPMQYTSAGQVLVSAFTTFTAKQQPEVRSLGALYIVLASWIVGVAVILAEAGAVFPARPISWWLRWGVVVAGIALGLGLLYALMQALLLVNLRLVTSLIDSFYRWMVLIWLVLTALLYFTQPFPAAAGRLGAWLGGGVGVALALFLTIVVNLQPVQADIIFKQGLRYDEMRQWDGAIQIYTSATNLAPTEDYYWLFLGRAMMERARVEQDGRVKAAIMNRTEQVLTKAQSLNPLNTDHTANLGRFYRTWAESETDATLRAGYIERSLAYYRHALELSPNSAQLIDELGQVYFIAGDDAKALEYYEASLQVDDRYANTYFYIGDLKLRTQDYAAAEDYYNKGLALEPNSPAALSAMAYALMQQNRITEAIDANLKVLSLLPQDINTLKNLALLNERIGQLDQAILYLRQAEAVAPDNQREQFTSYIKQLEQRMAGAGN